ncbi:MAG TPA: ferric reductase-like transmembrane domain-containing protein [Chloroflexota bacterium]|nr:ferric reductase-like transmembrane domain-containing protein [Chloroflexota bacterium]
MQNDLTAGGARPAPRMAVPRHGATPGQPPKQIGVRPAVPTTRAAQREGSEIKRAATWSVRVLFYGIAAVIAGLWLMDGGVTGVHDTGTLLISAGRFTGLFGAYLLLLQVLLLARLPFLQWAVGFDTLMKRHRLNGKVSLLLILAHVATITAGYALQSKISLSAQAAQFLTSWPDMVPALLGTLLLILVVVTSIVIVRRKLRYETWYGVHLMAYLGIFLAWLHQIPTGTEFLHNPLAAAFWTALYVVTLQLVLLFRVLQPALGFLWHRMRVTEVTREGPGVVSLRISGQHLDWLNAQPGQWFSWRFLDRARWREAHPFSLSAAPDGTSFRITIKDLGDFSHALAGVQPGTFVLAEGPFGAFTEEARTRDRVVLIAGGVGITAIRALLEELQGDLVLVYRAERAGDLLFRDELDALARARGMTIHYVLGDHRIPSNAHLLSREHLRSLVPDIAGRDVYLCGPSGMTRSVTRTLHRLGVPKALIHIDEFAF